MIYFVKAKRTFNISGTKENRYVAKIFRDRDCDLDTIAQEISHATSVSYPDTLAALKAFEIHIINHVSNGRAVKFGTLGAFIPAIHSKSVNNTDDVDADIIKRITCRFYPSVAFRNRLKSTGAEFKDLNKIKHV